MYFCSQRLLSGQRVLTHLICKQKLHFTAISSSPIRIKSAYESDQSLKQRLRRKLGLYGIPKWRMKESSAFLYESSTDGIKFEKFLNHCQMEDTFMSWFLVTTLHVWMIMARSMEEGAEGQFVRDQIVVRMWEDIAERIKKLTHLSIRRRNKANSELNQLFHAGLYAYDEGLMSDDKKLAAALWRIFFKFNCEDPVVLEMMVRYVREQLEWLSFIDKEIILSNGRIVWKDFRPLYP